MKKTILPAAFVCLLAACNNQGETNKGNDSIQMDAGTMNSGVPVDSPTPHRVIPAPDTATSVMPVGE